MGSRSRSYRLVSGNDLAELVEKGADADLLREMIRYVDQRMMDRDVENLCET